MQNNKKRTVCFAFQDDPVCFIHVLLNSINMSTQGMEGRIVLEGKAIALVSAIAEPRHFLNRLYLDAKNLGLFVGACRACATKLGVAEAIEAENIQLIGRMSGHPAMSDYIAQGYSIITF